MQYPRGTRGAAGVMRDHDQRCAVFAAKFEQQIKRLSVHAPGLALLAAPRYSSAGNQQKKSIRQIMHSALPVHPQIPAP
jgi:hypothetical protein